MTLAAPWLASAEAGVAFLEFAEKHDYAMEAEVGATVAGTGCKRVSVTYVKTNGAWNDLYKYGQRWGFCWNSRRRKITSLYGYERFKQCCDPGWSFVGHVGIVTTGWVGKSVVTRKAEGHFKFCPPIVGCVDHDYPWVKLWLYSSGGWRATKGNG